MMYGWDGNGWGIGAWVAMALLMLIFWGGVVTVVVLLVRRPHPGRDRPLCGRRTTTLSVFLLSASPAGKSTSRSSPPSARRSGAGIELVEPPRPDHYRDSGRDSSDRVVPGGGRRRGQSCESRGHRFSVPDPVRGTESSRTGRQRFTDEHGRAHDGPAKRHDGRRHAHDGRPEHCGARPSVFPGHQRGNHQP